MSSSSRRGLCENTINKKPVDLMIAAKSKCESKLKFVALSYDYEAPISQPDIATFAESDNNTQTPHSTFDNGLSAVKKRNSCAHRKGSLIIKKRGVALKSKAQVKKIAKVCPQTCDVEIEKESIFSSNVNQDIEDFEKNKSEAVKINREIQPNHHQKDFVHLENAGKLLEIAETRNRTYQKIEEIYDDKNFERLDKDAKSLIPQNKSSKIPRVKPNFFLSTHEESHAYPNARFPMGNIIKHSPKLLATCSEQETETYENNSKPEISNMINYQRKSRAKSTLRTIEENSTTNFRNLWQLEKSSEIDADEELEADLPTPTNESAIITGASGDPRSITFLKSLTLTCECRSCNSNKNTSPVHTARYTETDSWSSPEMESARNWHRELVKRRKFINTNSEDLDLSSDYDVVNHGEINGRNNEITKHADHIMRKSLVTDAAKMRTYGTTNFWFFNALFDIIFWPFIFLRTKQ